MEGAIKVGLARLEGEQHPDGHAVPHVGLQRALLEVLQHRDDPLARGRPRAAAALRLAAAALCVAAAAARVIVVRAVLVSNDSGS